MPTFFVLVVALLACFVEAHSVNGAEVTVTPSIAAGAVYNDNVYFTDKDKKGDFYTIVSPAFQLRQRDERKEIGMKAKVDSYSYAERSELDSVDPELSANGKYALSPVLSANASGLYKIDHQQDRALTSSGLISSNSKREQVQEALGLDWMLSELTTMGAKVTLGNIRYADKNYSGTASQSYNLEIKSNLSKFVPETTGLMNLTRSRYDYDLSQSNYTTATVGVGKNLNEKYSVTAWAGPSLIETAYKIAAIQESQEWGVTAHCALDGKFEKSTMNLSFAYDLQPDSYNSASVKRAALQGNFLRKITSELGLGITASCFRNDSSAKGNISTNDINGNTFNISPRILYQITDDLGLEANYLFSRIDNDNAANSRTQNSIFIQLTWSHSIDKSDLTHLL